MVVIVARDGRNWGVCDLWTRHCVLLYFFRQRKKRKKEKNELLFLLFSLSLFFPRLSLSTKKKDPMPRPRQRSLSAAAAAAASLSLLVLLLSLLVLSASAGQTPKRPSSPLRFFERASNGADGERRSSIINNDRKRHSSFSLSSEQTCVPASYNTSARRYVLSCCFL